MRAARRCVTAEASEAIGVAAMAAAVAAPEANAVIVLKDEPKAAQKGEATNAVNAALNSAMQNLEANNAMNSAMSSAANNGVNNETMAKSNATCAQRVSPAKVAAQSARAVNALSAATETASSDCH